MELLKLKKKTTRTEKPKAERKQKQVHSIHHFLKK